jgi:hypothetical protein
VGPKTSELVAVLEELVDLLESDGCSHWSEWMQRARTRLVSSDFSGIDYLLGAYGGMGSFNDLILGQTSVDGAFAWKPGHESLNERFSALRTKAFELAEFIKRNHDIGGT